MKFLLDTNIVSLYARNDQGVCDKIRAYGAAVLTISAITVMEIEYGLLKNPDVNKRTLERINLQLDEVSIVPFGFADALEAAKIRLEIKQQPIGFFDVLIAATARAHKFICVTRNVKEFARIQNLELLDWTSE